MDTKISDRLLLRAREFREEGMEEKKIGVVRSEPQREICSCTVQFPSMGLPERFDSTPSYIMPPPLDEPPPGFHPINGCGWLQPINLAPISTRLMERAQEFRKSDDSDNRDTNLVVAHVLECEAKVVREMELQWGISTHPSSQNTTIRLTTFEEFVPVTDFQEIRESIERSGGRLVLDTFEPGPMTVVVPVEEAVCELINRKAVHAKKGTVMGEEKWSDITNHMSEELNEFEGAVNAFNQAVEDRDKAMSTYADYYESMLHRSVQLARDNMLEEIGDMYGLLVHMTVKAGFTMEQVEQRELKKLKERFPE